jgi:hypothetical protein
MDNVAYYKKLLPKTLKQDIFDALQMCNTLKNELEYYRTKCNLKCECGENVEENVKENVEENVGENVECRGECTKECRCILCTQC